MGEPASPFRIASVVVQVRYRMRKFLLCLCICVLLHQHINAQLPSGLLAGIIRTNLVGYPVIHERKAWIFDPDVAVKRRKQFRELHGDKAEKLIERLGLGIDGRDEERLAEQKIRDEGHLGGLNDFLP